MELNQFCVYCNISIPQIMSSSDILEKYLQCTVCGQVYTDPHLLQCQHTFCYNCLVIHGDIAKYVHCPDCREVTKVSDLKADIKAQRMIVSCEALKKDQLTASDGLNPSEGDSKTTGMEDVKSTEGAGLLSGGDDLKTDESGDLKTYQSDFKTDENSDLKTDQSGDLNTGIGESEDLKVLELKTDESDDLQIVETGEFMNVGPDVVFDTTDIQPYEVLNAANILPDCTADGAGDVIGATAAVFGIGPDVVLSTLRDRQEDNQQTPGDNGDNQAGLNSKKRVTFADLEEVDFDQIIFSVTEGNECTANQKELKDKQNMRLMEQQIGDGFEQRSSNRTLGEDLSSTTDMFLDLKLDDNINQGSTLEEVRSTSDNSLCCLLCCNCGAVVHRLDSGDLAVAAVPACVTCGQFFCDACLPGHKTACKAKETTGML